MTVNGYRVFFGVDENVVEFWLVVTVLLCEYNENSCTLKKESGGPLPSCSLGHRSADSCAGVLVPSLDTCPAVALIARRGSQPSTSLGAWAGLMVALLAC